MANLTVEKLIDEGADIEERHDGWTPLMKAAETDHVDIMKLLLQANADIHATNKKGRAALSFAAAPSMGKETACRTLELLLKWSADVNQEDYEGFTARDRARREHRSDALTFFKEWFKRK